MSVKGLKPIKGEKSKRKRNEERRFIIEKRFIVGLKTTIIFFNPNLNSDIIMYIIIFWKLIYPSMIFFLMKSIYDLVKQVAKLCNVTNNHRALLGFCSLLWGINLEFESPSLSIRKKKKIVYLN